MPHNETADARVIAPLVAPRQNGHADLGWLSTRRGELSDREAAQRVAEFRQLVRDAARNARMPHAVFMRLRAFRQWS